MREFLSGDNKSDKTMFFVNIAIIFVHIFLMFIYTFIHSSLLIIINTLSIAFYVCMITTSYTNPKRYVVIAFTEVWTHMIVAALCFGWGACFQNYAFSIITACFLPAHEEGRDKFYQTVPYIYSFSVIITYFALLFVLDLMPSGSVLNVNDTIMKILFFFNNAVSFIAIMGATIFYTSKSKRKVYELTRKADFDELTLLYNRYAITQMNTQVRNHAQSLRKDYSIAILDIDHFKKVNDKYGHNSGDLILKEVSGMLKTISSKNIACGRWGGEEFILIGSDSMSYKEFMNILYKFNAKVYKTKFKIESGKEINLTVSIGAANVSSDLTIEEAVGAADTNLYEAKNTGRNKVMG